MICAGKGCHLNDVSFQAGRMQMSDSERVLQFWFEESGPSKWWTADASFDDEVRRRFGAMLHQATRGELFDWRSSAKGRLAEIIVLDQFSRNIHRGTALAYGQDPLALVLSQEAVGARAHLELSGGEIAFMLMPYMHSESRVIHAVAATLFRELAPKETFDFELRHKAIVDRFGRYPHRNQVLGRESTPEELEFLKEPGSSF